MQTGIVIMSQENDSIHKSLKGKHYLRINRTKQVQVLYNEPLKHSGNSLRQQAGGIAQLVACLPGTREALGSVPNTT